VLKLLHVKAAILDWAGTAVDHGSLAPVIALERLFAENGIAVTAAEIRRDMGLLKKDHIRCILAARGVADEREVERMFAAFVPKQAQILAEFSQPIDGVCEAVERWRAAGMRIGSTTGYTRGLLEIVRERAAKHGYSPDASVAADEVPAGRPAPFMCYRNAVDMGVYPLWACVKIGDTPADIAEGRNAGMWTVGITRTGNEVGLSKAELERISAAERERLERQAADRLMAAGADLVAGAVAECDAAIVEIERRLAAGDRP